MSIKTVYESAREKLHNIDVSLVVFVLFIASVVGFLFFLAYRDIRNDLRSEEGAKKLIESHGVRITRVIQHIDTMSNLERGCIDRRWRTTVVGADSENMRVVAVACCDNTGQDCNITYLEREK
jgi:hypothetical protein